ncbi:MAG TPA: ABC transporter permease [Candidatus Kapabacteria bacterium]|nr:ABC transporter permease [Candidatus Kapabacteria bacterium]
MNMIALVAKNSFRHKLRVLLTIAGIAIAVVAFGLLKTVVTAWNAGVSASSPNRLVTRQAVSFIFPLPFAYRDRIAQLDGIDHVTFLNWFGGVYKDKDQFFARLACDPETLFKVYPEYQLSKAEFENFVKERNSCVIGTELAKRYNLKIGDIMNIDGDIYPGKWQFTVRGIYTPRTKNDDASQMFFHWNYINEKIKAESPTRGDEIGWFVIRIKDPNRSATISKSIDQLFANSRAETKSESEGAFQQGFVASSGAILSAINIMSYLIIGIILLVLCNTMIMTARERTREYAVLKTLGFTTKHLLIFISGESLFISIMGAGIGILLLTPLVQGFESALPKGWFPVFYVEPGTYILSAGSALIVGIAASIVPIYRAFNTKIVDGLRFNG